MLALGARVFRVWDQPIDSPALDLVGRPRSAAISRAGARTRDGGEVLALLPPMSWRTISERPQCNPEKRRTKTALDGQRPAP